MVSDGEREAEREPCDEFLFSGGGNAMNQIASNGDDGVVFGVCDYENDLYSRDGDLPAMKLYSVSLDLGGGRVRAVTLAGG